MDDFLSKPFQRQQLVAILTRVTALAMTAAAPAAVQGELVADVAPATPDPGADAPILDLQVLEEIRALQNPDKPDLLAELLRMFLDRSPEQVRGIVAAAAAPDAALLSRNAHALKGACGNLGLVAMADLLGKIERLARRDQLTEAAPLVERLPSAHDVAAAALGAELARDAGEGVRTHG
ncbi:MAG: Hpt domain-containing protein [Kofleriaceae bacterium]